MCVPRAILRGSHPHLALYDRGNSPGSSGRSPSPAYRVRPRLLPPPGLVSVVLVVQVFSGPVSRSPFLPMVNPNTVVRRHLSTHSSLVSLFLPRTAWYEWYPGLALIFSDISISAGDAISLSVIASSTTSGRARIANVTNGKTVEQILTSNTPLCGQSAEWIVEDYDYLHSTNLVPFADFGTVTFTGAVAAGTGGSGYYAASQGSTTDIEQNGQVLTSTSVSSEFSVTIKYAGSQGQATT